MTQQKQPVTKVKKAPRLKSVLTEQQSALIDGKLDGLTNAAAGLQAGYTTDQGTSIALKSPDVKRALAEARSELMDACQIKRMDVIAGIEDAISLARATQDPTAMIRGYTEIAKMLGFYAPEKKEITLTAGQAQMRGKFVVMSDAQLLDMAQGKLTIDGEAKIVD